MSEETLAGEYARKLKAVAETNSEQMEALYREYQEKYQCLMNGGQGEGRKEPQTTDSPVLPSAQRSAQPQKKKE